MRLPALALTAILALAASPAAAATIGFGFNMGPVTSKTDLTGAFSGFRVGEEVLFEFTIDSTTPDTNGIPGFGRFRDPTATAMITGLSGGPSLILATGLQLSFNGVSQIEITGISGPFDAFVLSDGINLQGSAPFVTNAENLAQSIGELQAAVTDGLFTGIENISNQPAQILNLPIGASDLNNLTFGPVNTATKPISAAVVPLPAGGLLLLTGLLAVAALRWRKSRLVPIRA